jgi:hypothetical protein
VSDKTTEDGQTPRVQFDMEKMRRFGRWLFAEETPRPSTNEDQPSDEIQLSDEHDQRRQI